MTSEQLKCLPKDLVMIASHCVTHPNLAFLSEENIKKELAESKTHWKRY
jgi:hypothetical protein